MLKPDDPAPPRRPDPALADGRDLWVFGYGSLMWDPGFEHLERRPALLHGFHRRFCVYSSRYRGTPDRPGLVLGLDRGGSCHGVAYRIQARRVAASLDYLCEREMLTGVYRLALCRVRAGGELLRAGCFLVDRQHAQYCSLSLEETADLISHGRGQRGSNHAYLANTVRHLDELGIHDRQLHHLLALVEERRSASSTP
jgi:cation transport protein ChaC